MVDYRIRVIVDPSGAVDGSGRAETSLRKVEQTANSLRGTLVRAFAATGLAVGIGSSVSLLADFSQEMSRVRAISGATAEEFSLLNDRAQELGATTRFSATQAAEGMTLLAQAGFTANETISTVDDTLNLAQAGALSLATAADITASTLRGFRLQVDQAGRVVDVLAAASNTTNSSVISLGEGLKFVAPIAAGLKVPLEETVSALGNLSNAGLDASLAGTGLRRVLSELESPSEVTNRILRSLGVTTEQVRVSQVGLTSALRVLRDAGLNTGQALEVFGDRGGPAFEVLSEAIPSIQSLTSELGDAGGSTAKVAAIMNDNLNGALLKVRSSMQAFILQLGDAGASNALTQSLLGVAEALRFLAGDAEAAIDAAIALGAGYAAIKLAPFVASLQASTAAMIEESLAVEAGTAVRLGSIAAIRQQAAAEIASAEAAVAASQARLAVIASQIEEASVTFQTNATIATQIVLRERESVVMAQLIAANAALQAAQARSTAGSIAAEFATGKLTAAKNLLNKSFAVSPFTILIAGATAAYFTLRELNEVLEETAEARKIADAGADSGLTDYGKVGEDILRVQRNLLTVQRSIAADESNGGVANPNAIALAERYESQLEKLRERQKQIAEGTDEAKRAAREERAEVEALNTAYQDQIDKLGEESRILKLNSKEREVQSALLQAITSIERDGSKLLTDTQKNEIESNLRIKQSLEDRAAVLDRVRKPQEDLARAQAAAQELLKEGVISLREYAIASEAFAPLASTLAGLNQEATLLGFLNRERDIQSRMLNEERALREAGATLLPLQRQVLESRLRENQALSDQADLLQQIRGPQDDYRARQAALFALLETGRITAEEYNRVANENGLERINADTEEQIQLLSMSASARETEIELIRIRNDLLQQGAPALTPEEEGGVRSSIERTRAAQDEAAAVDAIRRPQEEAERSLRALNSARDAGRISAEEYTRAIRSTGLERVNFDLEEQVRLLGLSSSAREIESERLRIENQLRAEGVALSEAERESLVASLQNVQAQSDRARVLEDLRGPQEHFQRDLEAINSLMADGTITADEYAIAIENLHGRTVQTANTLSGGFQDGLATVKARLADVSGAVEKTVVDGFGAAEDAIVSFAKTGKADFSSFVDSVLDDLLHLLAQQALSGLIGSFGGGFAGGFASIFGGARAGGGDVEEGKTYLVGEGGKELFTPESAGTITPAGETAALLSRPSSPVINVPAPSINIANYTVDDPSEIPAAIESDAGANAVLNVLRKRRRSATEIMGR